jgi:hypothetical protein
VEFKCPFCDDLGGLNTIHRHLVDAHTDLVQTEHDEETGKMQYTIDCPVCELKYRHAIKPRYRNSAFLEEFKTEIAMVAFDQLLYHLAKDHSAETGIDLQAPQTDD